MDPKSVSKDVISLIKSKEKKLKLDYIKLKCFCLAKEAQAQIKRHSTEWKKICAHNTLNNRLLSKYEARTKINYNKSKISLKLGLKNKPVSEEDRQMDKDI